MVRRRAAAFAETVLLTVSGHAQRLASTGGLASSRLEIVTDQRAPGRIQAVAQNPSSSDTWLNVHVDSANAIQSVTAAIITHTPANGQSRLKVLAQAVATAPANQDETFVVRMKLVSRKTIDSLPAGTTAEIGLVGATFFDGTRWAYDVVAHDGFERLPADAPELHVRPFFEREPKFGEGLPSAKTPGCREPTPIRQVNPKYSAAAMSQRIQGDVEIDAIVLKTGIVGKIHIAQSLDPYFGLDSEAAAAARRWTFKPGTCEG